MAFVTTVDCVKASFQFKCLKFVSGTKQIDVNVLGSPILCGKCSGNCIFSYYTVWGDRGGTVVKVLCYKSEGRWFNSRWRHWNFSLT